MPSERRLTASEHFRLAYREGLRISDGLLTIYARTNGLPVCRVGVAVPARFGPAVRRNRVKRRVRAASRAALNELPAGVDIVIVPKESASIAAFRALQESVRALYKRLAEMPR